MLFGCLNESGWTEIFPNIDPTSLVYGPCCQKWARLPDAHKLNSVFEAFIPSPSGTRFSDFIIVRFSSPPPPQSYWKITLMIMRSLIREFRGPKLSQIWSKNPSQISHAHKTHTQGLIIARAYRAVALCSHPRVEISLPFESLIYIYIFKLILIMVTKGS